MNTLETLISGCYAFAPCGSIESALTPGLRAEQIRQPHIWVSHTWVPAM